MAANHVYKVPFFLQSAVFILVLIAYSQKSDIIPGPVAKTRDTCNCYSQSVLKAYRRAAVSWWPAHLRNGSRGAISNCTLDDVLKRPGVVMLTTTNTGFLDMMLNMLESIKRAGVCVNTTIVAEDQKCYEYLRERATGDPAVYVVKTTSGETRSEEILRGNRSEYNALFNKRQGYILDLLQHGFDVLLTDSDTFWFQDPFPYFEGDYDMSMMDPRSPYPLRTPKSYYCAGFAYFKPTDVTIRFVKSWIQTMRDNDKIGKLLPDQGVMNKLLRSDKPSHVNVQPLDWSIFPWGPKFYELLHKDPNYTAVVMHAASIRGRAAKVAKFKTSNMWLMNTSIEEMIGKQ